MEIEQLRTEKGEVEKQLKETVFFLENERKEMEREINLLKKDLEAHGELKGRSVNVDHPFLEPLFPHCQNCPNPLENRRF